MLDSISGNDSLIARRAETKITGILKYAAMECQVKKTHIRPTPASQMNRG